MLRTKVVKGVLGVSALAALFAAAAVHAQSGAGTQSGTSGQGTAGTQQGSTGTTGTGGTSGTGGTDMQRGSTTQGATGSQQGTVTGTAGQGMAGRGAMGQSGQATQGATGSAAGTQATMAASSAPLSRADRKMLMDFTQANMAEIEASRMAQQKSQNEQVKNFAQQMIDDHTKALGDAQQLAQAKGITLPTGLDRAHRARAKRLEGLSGEAFDRAYMAQAGVADHKKTHSMLRQGQARAKDPDLKALVARTLPVVSQHLNSATQLHSHTARGSSKAQGETGSSDRR